MFRAFHNRLSVAVPRTTFGAVRLTGSFRRFTATANRLNVPASNPAPNSERPASTTPTPVPGPDSDDDTGSTRGKRRRGGSSSTHDRESGSGSGSGSGYSDRFRSFIASPFVSAGLPLILMVVGGAYALSHTTVHRFEASHRHKSGTDAAAKGAANSIRTSVAYGKQHSATAATAATTESTTTSADVSAPLAPPTTTAAAGPGVGGGLADGSMPAQHTRGVAAPKNPKLTDREQLELELQRMRSSMNWDKSYENVRVPRPKGMEDNYYTGADQTRTQRAAASKS